jgi:hypothetical protein
MCIAAQELKVQVSDTTMLNDELMLATQKLMHVAGCHAMNKGYACPFIKVLVSCISICLQITLVVF